jgi:hypothetical protein
VISLRDSIIDALKTVYDPEIPVDIWNLGLIYDITEVDDEGKVRITMTLTSAWCPEAEQIPVWVKTEVEKVKGVERAFIDVVFTPEWTPDLASDEAKIIMGITE